MQTIELFSGSGHISKALQDNGFKTFTVDFRKRKGVCEPDLQTDIKSLKYLVLLNNIQKKYNKLDEILLVWASVPCTCWSIAANGKHFNGKIAKTEEGLESIQLLKKTISLIRLIKPKYYFIENPRGELRYNKTMIDFLIDSKGLTRQTFWGDYGFPTPKPTNIFTNCYDLKLRADCKYGRGAICDFKFNNLTQNQRQSIPVLFADDFAKQIKFYQSEQLTII